MNDLSRYVSPIPHDVQNIIDQSRQLSARESYGEQTRDYHIDCVNGDRVDIHEVTACG